LLITLKLITLKLSQQSYQAEKDLSNFIFMKVVFSFLLVSLILVACECDDRLCDEFPDSNNRFVPLETQNLIFKNARDSTIEFDLISVERTQKSVVECEKDYFGLCGCDCPRPSAVLSYRVPSAIHVLDSQLIEIDSGRFYNGTIFTTDTSFYSTFFYYYNDHSVYIIDFGDKNPPTLRIDFLGSSLFSYIDRSTNQIRLSNGENYTVSRLPTFQTTYETYSNVTVFNLINNSSSRKPQIVSKLYYKINRGVIAFQNENDELFSLMN